MKETTCPSRKFGKQEDCITYRTRISAYGIYINDENKIPVVHTPVGYFLLGGGVEGTESNESCIMRECMEEAGLTVSVGSLLCTGENYVWSPSKQEYLHIVASFYQMTILDDTGEQIELDHTLEWLTPEECTTMLYHEHQKWAVREQKFESHI